MGVISFDLKCLHCGDSLTGLKLDDRCPTCRMSIGTTVDVTLIDFESMVVCHDAKCVTCGYNLRTRSLDSLCPECATFVATSLGPAGHQKSRWGERAAWTGYLLWFMFLATFVIAEPLLPGALRLVLIFAWGVLPWTAFLVGVASARDRAPHALAANGIGLVLATMFLFSMFLPYLFM